MCGVLLAILFWTIRKLLEVLKNNAEVIVLNTKAIDTLNVNLTESKGEIRGLKEELYRRPCVKSDD